MCIANEGKHLKCGCDLKTLEPCKRAIQNNKICRMKDLRFDDRDDYCDGICSLVYGMDADELAHMIDQCHNSTSRPNKDGMVLDEVTKKSGSS